MVSFQDARDEIVRMSEDIRFVLHSAKELRLMVLKAGGFPQK